MQHPIIRMTVVAALARAPLATAQLKVDFNSLTQDGGPHPTVGYESYDAGHEVATDFVPRTYLVDFGGGPINVTITPGWPNTAANQVMQMIDRGAGNDANWVGNDIDLLTDWIGADSRTSQGGNGDWDRTTGTPTYITLTISGLPACSFEWLSYHHDTENIWSDFQVEVSSDGGAVFGAPIDMEMTSSSPGGNPPDPIKETGANDPDPKNLSSTFTTIIQADGTSDVVLRFAHFTDGVDPIAVHKQLFGMNGFELECVIGTNFCSSVTNSLGVRAGIVASGSASVAVNSLVLTSSPVPDQPGVFIYGVNQTQIPFGQGLLCVTGLGGFIYPPVFATQNTAVKTIDNATLPAGPITSGSTWNFQHIYRDPAGGGAAFNSSDGISITFTP